MFTLFRHLISQKTMLFIGDELHGIVFVRLQICCKSSMEFSYYSSNIGKQDLCSYCVNTGAEKDKELVKSYKVVLPICGECKKKPNSL